MLARSGTSAGGDGWALEIKWDGARMQAAFDGRSICLRSRPGRSCTDEFPEIEPDGIVARTLILDGELVCFGSDALPDFAALRNRLGQRPRFHGRRRPVLATFVAFDILHLDGYAVRDLPYLRRRELLAELALDTPRWRTPPHAVSASEQEALRTLTHSQNLEGIVAKRLDAPYVEGRRSASWVKSKLRRRQELVITGWREPRDGCPAEFLLARPGEDGALRPAGSASFGLGAERREQLLEVLAAHEVPGRSKRRSARAARWAQPKVTVTVDAHGREHGPVRDAVLRDFSVSSGTADGEWRV